MGEKAQEGSRSLRQLPAAGAVALGAVVGLVVAAPIALVIAGDDEDDVAVVVPTTTSSTTTTVAGEAAAVSVPAGSFAVVLTQTSFEVADPDLDVSAAIGTVVEGSTLECTTTTCTLDLVIGGLVAVVDLQPDGDGLRGTFRYDIGDNPRCEGSGVDVGAGSVSVRPDGDGFRGTLAFASDLFAVVDGVDGEPCGGVRSEYDFVAAPAALSEGPFTVVVTATSIEAPDGVDASGTVGEVVPGTTFTCDGPACTLDFVRGSFRAVVSLERGADGVHADFRWDYAPENCDGTGTDSGTGRIDLSPDGDGYRGSIEFVTDVFAVVNDSCAGARRGFDLVLAAA